MTTESTADNLVLYDILIELRGVREHYGPFASCHEGVGVLWEEFDELKAEVWKKKMDRRKDLMYQEAVQVAAVAVRFASDLCMNAGVPVSFPDERARAVLLRDQAQAQCDRMREQWQAALKETAEVRSDREKLLVLLEAIAAIGGWDLPEVPLSEDDIIHAGNADAVLDCVRALAIERNALARALLNTGHGMDLPVEMQNRLSDWAEAAPDVESETDDETITAIEDDEVPF